jgi:hypothetical protein
VLLLSLPHGDAWVRAGQALAAPDTWSNSQLQALATTHAKLIQEYKCAEQQPQHDAPAAPAAAQVPQAPTPLLIPPLNQLAQLRAARAHGENGCTRPADARSKENHSGNHGSMPGPGPPHSRACTWNRPQRQHHALAPALADHPMHIKTVIGQPGHSLQRSNQIFYIYFCEGKNPVRTHYHDTWRANTSLGSAIEGR